MTDLHKKIEAVLFWRAEPVSIKRLSEWLKTPAGEIQNALTELETSLSTRGIVLVKKEDEVMLGTTPEASDLIESLAKEELNRDLGKAGLETLSIILYFGPITRSEIDYIRGVNSTFVLRTLLIRGLVERVQNQADQRSFLYKPTFELLSLLGISDLSKLPEYETVRSELKAFKKAQSERDEAEKAAEKHETASQTPVS